MTALPIAHEQQSARRAVEALRSGVPSRDGVAALGSGQGEIEDRFAGLLDSAGTVRPSGSRGLLLGGGFGSGKSHLLEHLAHLALDRGFAVSRIVISKETPLHDPVKVLRAAVESAISPNGAIGAVAEAAAGLDPGSPGFAELLRWASGGPVDERFPLTVSLFPHAQAGDDDFADAIVRFWSGDRLAVADLRRQAKLAGEGRRALVAVPARELAIQRLRFLARLFVAAGCQGWVLLFDEVELIGRYTLLQRGRSYGELADWLMPDPDDPAGPLATVLAMTDDFDAAVLTEKNDRELVPIKLRAKQQSQWDEVAAKAETGMRLIERDMLLLQPPDAAELEQTYRRLKSLHSEAFGWDAPDVAGLERLGATRMRQYVRAWINEWDLVRLDPHYRPQTEVTPLSVGYDEVADLDTDENGSGPEDS
ncbi:MAG: BREX system ATP-binding domain-containing protein [Jatrophihabitantaceae bacterium]